MLLKNIFKVLGIITLLFSEIATAGQALSWDLSRALMNGMVTNPKANGVWAFMQNEHGNTNPANYTLLPNHSRPPCFSVPTECWYDPLTLAGISIPKHSYIFKDSTSRFRLPKGIAHAHPGFNNQVIFRWSSPISGTINIIGRVSDINPDCGDGIKWYLNNGLTTLQFGVLLNGTGATFMATDIFVTPETKLYFIIDKNRDYACDSTNLDMMITSQQ